jgi:hypothetical protein
MNLKRLINKLLENKNFYYVILALTALHLILYTYRGSYKSIAFLVLCAIIIYNFNKKPVVVLLLSLIATHFFVAGGNVYEGLENKVDEKIKNEENIDKLKNTDPELANAATKVSEGTINRENVKQIAEAKKNVAINVSSKIKDVNNPDMNESTSTSTEEPVPESFEGGKKGTVRLDHAATIETAYDDLQNILGSDGISKLTDDTKKLMSQQKNLFNAMNELAPAVKETMSMLEGLNMSEISNMSSSTSKVADQLKNLMSTNKVKASNDKSA